MRADRMVTDPQGREILAFLTLDSGRRADLGAEVRPKCQSVVFASTSSDWLGSVVVSHGSPLEFSDEELQILLRLVR